MAALITKKRAKDTKKPKAPPTSYLCRFLCQIPAALLLLVLIFLWASSTAVISGSFVHVCLSSRKLNHLYCLSAGTQRNFDVPLPVLKEDKEFSRPTQENNRSTTGSKNEDYLNAVKVVEEQLQAHRSWISKSANSKACDGRGVYVYDLPTKFNKDLIEQCSEMVPWMNYCNYFKNEAMGEPIPKLGNGWHHTHQYSLEPIFHSRVLRHPCRVYNENEGKLFYVPYYGGLDILRWHFKNVTEDVKDSLGMELMQWLEMQQAWNRNKGRDHVFVLGKISWDFRRSKSLAWGTSFLEHSEMQNPLKLLIERQPWHINDIGVPHPTYFHPHTDNEIVEWQLKIIRARRDNLISFAGAARPGATENIRTVLIEQCTSRNDTSCRFLDCSGGGCSQPATIIELFTQSEFCLQPPGDSPTRKSVFDSLISGCIPVLFDPFTAYYQYPWHLPQEHSRYSVFIDQDEVRNMTVNVVERLLKVSQREREDLRRYIVYELLPGLIYGDSSSAFDRFQDAFAISMDNLIDRVTRLSSDA